MPRWSTIVRAVFSRFMAGTFICQPLDAEGAAPQDDVVPLIVRTPHGGFNRMVVSVTVCEPGTDRCTTIDDVMVDTGSTGLRLEASAVPSSLHLPAFSGPDGKPLAECLHFVHDAAWGPLSRADVRIGGMTASNLAIQVIADGGAAQPAECPVSDVKPTSNGTLGVGPWLVDCPGDCVQDERRPGVFAQDGGAWSPLRGPVDRAYRLRNPAAAFPGHDDGVAFDLPMPPDKGAAQIIGTLTFGIGKASNDQFGGARVIRLDVRGRFTTRYGGRAYPESYIDSGTETNLLPEGDVPRCEGMPWAFCANPSRNLAATMVGRDGTSVDVAFRVGDYRGALDRHVGAWDGFAEVGTPTSGAFVWGAPFFLGRRVFVIFEGRGFPGMIGVGPGFGFESAR